MTKEAYIQEHNTRSANYKNERWQEEYRILEKQHVENFVTSGKPPTELLEKLEKCLTAQKWISAKSSAHQYTLMKDFTDIDDVEFDDITTAIGKYGFFGYYWCDLHQYLIIGDFYYWSSLYPRAWELINRARIDTPPKEAYFSNFTGEWAKVGKPNIKSFSYPCNPFTGERLFKNPWSGELIQEFNVKPDFFEFEVFYHEPHEKEEEGLVYC